MGITQSESHQGRPPTTSRSKRPLESSQDNAFGGRSRVRAVTLIYLYPSSLFPIRVAPNIKVDDQPWRTSSEDRMSRGVVAYHTTL